MTLALNKYWILVAVCIIANIFIFIFLSKKLESHVVGIIVENQRVEY